MHGEWSRREELWGFLQIPITEKGTVTAGLEIKTETDRQTSYIDRVVTMLS